MFGVDERGENIMFTEAGDCLEIYKPRSHYKNDSLVADCVGGKGFIGHF